MSAPDANVTSHVTSNPTSSHSADATHREKSHKKHDKKHAKGSHSNKDKINAVVLVVACAVVLLLVVAATGVGLVVMRRSVGCPPLQNLPAGAVVIDSPMGKLVGTTVSTNSGVSVNHWQGVPYARSGPHRFAKPEPLNDPSKCETVLAVQPRPPCAQWVNGQVLGSEDCLHLNVWAPTAPSDGKRPLVLAATGHWFQRSTTDVPQWADLAAQGGVVVMAPNVRMGVLGFLHPEKAPGFTRDVAEEDMMAAMRWAMDNAAVFGADPTALMLAGNGSGAYMLVQAAGRLNVSVVRAVIEGSVYTSAVPANDGEMEPSKELAGMLNCSVKDRSTWLSCFSNATLDALLSATARMDLRFTPLWNAMMFALDTSEKKLPTIQTVIAGTDLAQTKAFVEEYVSPTAKVTGNETKAQALARCTVTYIVGRDQLALRVVMSKLKGKSDEQMSSYLNLVLSGCATRSVALRAADKGYHYVVDGGGRPLFEPLLGTADVAKFLSDGSVPSLKDGKTWEPATLSTPSRIVKDDGSEVLGSVEGAEFCRK
ncbi:liver carboxylesterase 1-like [Dermacentor variabilis]|uniref:liver carboxylesterase 1-like n=1 Tax=Dermacentor variabilis TaxID=34621 RepID=UPI003F5B4868